MVSFWFPDMTTRSYEEELMDRSDCSPEKLRRTIEQFDLLNTLFSSALALFKRHILPVLLKDRSRVWTFLDFGAGGCDIDRRIVRLCRKKNLHIKITALDFDGRIVPWARELNAGFPEIDVVEGSVFDMVQFGDFDFVLSNHTLHHFTYPQVKSAVELSARHSRCGFLLNDLRRSKWAYVGYTIFTGLFVRKSLAFYDGRLSIRRGFTVEELRETLIDGDGLSNLTVNRAAPARIYLWLSKGGPS